MTFSTRIILGARMHVRLFGVHLKLSLAWNYKHYTHTYWQLHRDILHTDDLISYCEISRDSTVLLYFSHSFNSRYRIRAQTHSLTHTHIYTHTYLYALTIYTHYNLVLARTIGYIIVSRTRSVALTRCSFSWLSLEMDVRYIGIPSYRYPSFTAVI